MFTPSDRERVRERVLELARNDERVTGAAMTGSASVGADDRWSDIDLSFGVADGMAPRTVLEDWTHAVGRDLGVLHHWDLHVERTVYRVFLLPGGLELDVAVTPATEYGAHGPKFRLLFGQSNPRHDRPDTAVDEMIGWGWLHVLDAAKAIERGNAWAAEYWISALRDRAQALACMRADLPSDHARGVDRLPAEALAAYEDALVRSLDRAELRRALWVGTERFLGELVMIDASLAERIAPTLRHAARGDESRGVTGRQRAVPGR